MAKQFSDSTAAIFTHIPDKITREWMTIPCEGQQAGAPLLKRVTLTVEFDHRPALETLTAIVGSPASVRDPPVWKASLYLWEKLQKTVDELLVAYRSDRPEENYEAATLLTASNTFDINSHCAAMVQPANSSTSHSAHRQRKDKHRHQISHK